MRFTQTVFAALSLSVVALSSGPARAAESASPPTAAQPASSAPNQAKITKSRSNIQNNRQTAAPVKQTDVPQEPKQLVKTKTKSNQSND